MLSTIMKSWPPRPGPDEAHTGYKQTHMRPDPIFGFTELLDDLHADAWWTGVRLIIPAYVADVARFSVRLVDREGRPFFEDRCVWDQGSHVWTPFPWPIPAGFAKTRGLQLRVSRIDCDEPLFMSMKTCFHEIAEAGPFVFINESRAPLLFWTGAEWGSWNSQTPALTYRPVPPFGLLHDWDDNQMFAGPAAAGAMDMD